MDYAEVLRRRRMVRSYDPARPLSLPVVDGLLAAGRRAPSAGGSEGWHFLALTTTEQCAAYWMATAPAGRTDDPWLAGMRSAPVIILVFSDRAAYERRYAQADKQAAGYAPRDLDARWPVPYWHVDAGMAGALILLAAVDAGLGACWFGVPTAAVAAVRSRFAIPDGLVPVGAITIGYPAEPGPRVPRQPGASRHRPWSEVVSYGRFGGRADDHSSDDSAVDSP